MAINNEPALGRKTPWLICSRRTAIPYPCMGSRAKVFRMSISRVPWMRSLGLSDMNAFPLTIKRKNTLSLLIVKRRVARLQAAKVWARRSRLFEFAEGFYLSFERLIILPLDLKLGLQLFDKQLEVRDFHAQLLHFVGGRKRSRGRRCIGLSIGGRLRWRTRRKSFGQRAGPGRFCGCRRSRRRGNGARSGRCRRKKIA